MIDSSCSLAFELLKSKLSFAPIIAALNWKYGFEFMCDASACAVGIVLGQIKEDKIFHAMHYACKFIN